MENGDYNPLYKNTCIIIAPISAIAARSFIGSIAYQTSNEKQICVVCPNSSPTFPPNCLISTFIKPHTESNSLSHYCRQILNLISRVHIVLKTLTSCLCVRTLKTNIQRRRRLRRVAIPNSQTLSLLGRDIREAHLQVLLGGGNGGFRASNATVSNATTDPFLSSLILSFPSCEAEEISKSVVTSSEDSFAKNAAPL